MKVLFMPWGWWCSHDRGTMVVQVSRMFGTGDEFGEENIMGKLESMKAVIERVNEQFRNAVCYLWLLLSWQIPLRVSSLTNSMCLTT